MRNRKVVWDLFGGLNGSVGLAIDKYIYDIYTVDILPFTKDGRKNIVIDLATENIDKLINELRKLPQPDIIVASPMCKTFSRARGLNGGNDSYILVNNKLTHRSKESFIYENSLINRPSQTYENMVITRKFGELGIKNTLKILEVFKPNKWYIENPNGSYIWKYIESIYKGDYILNDTYYGDYGGLTPKKTTFMSNVKMELKCIGGRTGMNLGMLQRKDRSDIPKNLLFDIFNIFEGGDDNE